MALRNTARALAVALLGSFFVYRWASLRIFFYNSPESLERVNVLPNVEIRFRDDIRNCEDIYLNEDDGWALLSCDPSRDLWNTVMGTFVNSTASPGTGIYLYDYTQGAGARPERIELGLSEGPLRDFHPLGLDYHPESRTLIIANHGPVRCTIELYEMDIPNRRARRLRVLQWNEFAAPNSFALISPTEFFFTDDHYFLARHFAWLSKLETYTGVPGGSVVHVKILDDGTLQTTTLARVAFANGIVLLDSTTLAVASTANANVKLYTLQRDAREPPRLTSSRRIPLPFLPDNLSVDSEGKLLIAGHPWPPSVEKIAKNNRLCHDAGEDALNILECQIPRLSWISEWSKEEGLKTLYAGDDFGTSTTAVRDVSRGVGFASGLYERGLLVWKI